MNKNTLIEDLILEGAIYDPEDATRRACDWAVSKLSNDISTEDFMADCIHEIIRTWGSADLEPAFDHVDVESVDAWLYAFTIDQIYKDVMVGEYWW